MRPADPRPDEGREVLVGVSLSLSGRFRPQGEQARDGLRLWAEAVSGEGGVPLSIPESRYPLRLLVLDDGSRESVAHQNVLRLLDHERVDLLIGPYSSGLTLAVAPLVGARGKVLWNHGGSSDAIFQQGWRHVVSVPSPASDYFRRLPWWLKEQDPRASRLSILYATTGSFAGHVVDGVAESARAAGFEPFRLISFASPIEDPRAALRKALEPQPDLLVAVGSFEDDTAIVRERALLPDRTRLAVVAAGLAAFQAALGDLSEGVIGPSQWEPTVPETPGLGPDSACFCEAFQRTFQRIPEYPAAQAFALGLVLTECLRRAGSLESESLLGAAHALETTTLYGRFRLEPLTSRQIGHQIRLVQWRAGRKVVIG